VMSPVVMVWEKSEPANSINVISKEQIVP
jgi:hypothetical protein